MNFIAKLIKECIRLVIYAVVFVLLAWIFLGLSPRSTWNRFLTQAGHVTSFVTGSARNVSETASDMANVAKYHLNEASDRIDGKDPYEDFNNRLSNGLQ